MEVASLLFSITVSFLIFLFALVSKSIIQNRSSRRNLPPSPPALPIIGHLLLLKEPLHRNPHELSEKYDLILFRQFGTRSFLLVSSASAAEECFTKNDIIFANRPQLLAGKHLDHNNTTVALAPYAGHWRKLRRLTTLELFSTSRLAMFASIRQEEVQLLLKELFLASSSEAAKVEITSKLIELVFNIMLRMIAGKRYYGIGVMDKEAKDFRDIMRECAKLHGSTNLNDFLPMLQVIDFQGMKKRMKGIAKKLDKFLQSLIEEHRRMREDSSDLSLGASDAGNKGRKATLIDVMLSLALQQAELEFYTDETIKGVIQVIMLRRFDGGEGKGYKLLPFGAGRRACPGAVLGKQVVGLVLGVLIQSFKWNGIGQEEIDMREGTGFSMPKAEPLVALCNPCPDMINFLSTL